MRSSCPLVSSWLLFSVLPGWTAPAKRKLFFNKPLASELKREPMRISKQVVIMAVLMMASAVAFSHAQEPTRNYSDTRKLLLKMDRTRANGAFTKIVREADIRRTSLLAAVDDDTDKVQVNAQVIIRYMGDPEMLRALDDRIKAHLAKHLRLASPIISPIEADMYLYGSDTDPMKIVKKNASLFHGSQFNSGET